MLQNCGEWPIVESGDYHCCSHCGIIGSNAGDGYSLFVAVAKKVRHDDLKIIDLIIADD
jgi:hypothetical protein